MSRIHYNSSRVYAKKNTVAHRSQRRGGGKHKYINETVSVVHVTTTTTIMIINVVGSGGGGGSNGRHILHIILYYYLLFIIIIIIHSETGIVLVFGRARVLSFSLALTLATRLLLLLQPAVARSGHNIIICILCISRSRLRDIVTHTHTHNVYVVSVCMGTIYIYIYYQVQRDARTTRPSATQYDVSGASLSSVAVSLSRTRPPPITYTPVDPRLGPQQQLQTNRLPTYRPTDRPTEVYTYTCRRPSAVCSTGSSHHHHHPRTIPRET